MSRRRTNTRPVRFADIVQAYKEMWELIQFPISRPHLERAFLVLLLMVLHPWRLLYYFAHGTFNAPLVPAEIIGFSVRIPTLPFSTFPVVGWFFAMAVFLVGLFYANSKSYRDAGHEVSDLTWRYMAYFFEWCLLVMLFTKF